MNKEQLICKLDVRSRNASACGDSDYAKGVFFALEAARQLDDKVELTEEEADRLSVYRGCSLAYTLQDCEKDDTALFAEARILGYTIKKEKYRVKIGSNLYFKEFIEDEAVCIVDDAPGKIEQALVYDDAKVARGTASILGGVVKKVEEE